MLKRESETSVKTFSDAGFSVPTAVQGGGVFRCVRINFIMYGRPFVCLFVGMYQHGSFWTIFHEI
jgi:hypothetical protein